MLASLPLSLEATASSSPCKFLKHTSGLDRSACFGYSTFADVEQGHLIRKPLSPCVIL